MRRPILALLVVIAEAALALPAAGQDAGLSVDEEPVMHSGSIDRFVEAVGQPHDEVWDERLSNIELRIADTRRTEGCEIPEDG